ncbi:LysR family transcriptional regulator [Stutzerimonas kirkiae]|uniref:LysR family transcriptional regulator n=1 Tax=Stutzerimonas kirkiae TaxID=2211392 RepID=UPI0010382D98|nr:LysR family transcriptional regulator [Stutzerimonas kirkiae]TBV14356.1 LysR family transcriptional regulator [Stutzerimonas kirkiae]
MPLTDLGQLALFVRIVEAGSLSNAAHELGTTLPSVSRRLRQLESRLGVRLLQRTTRRQSLTGEGDILYRHALQILADVEQVEQRLSLRSATVSGHLRLTAPISLGRRRIAPLLADFQALHPQLHVQLELTDTVLDLVESGMDLAIRYGALDDSSYFSRPLVANYRVLCAAPSYLKRHGMPRHPSDLASHRCLHIGHQPQADWHFEGEQPVTVRITAMLAANDGDVVHRWALGGHGIALKSIWDITDDLANGHLVRVLPEYPSPATPLHAMYPHNRQLAPRVRVFIDYLLEHLPLDKDAGHLAERAGA